MSSRRPRALEAQVPITSTSGLCVWYYKQYQEGVAKVTIICKYNVHIINK